MRIHLVERGQKGKISNVEVIGRLKLVDIIKEETEETIKSMGFFERLTSSFKVRSGAGIAWRVIERLEDILVKGRK